MTDDMPVTTDISKGYPCGHHVSAEYVTGGEQGRDLLDVYRCTTCGQTFGVLIVDA